MVAHKIVTVMISTLACLGTGVTMVTPVSAVTLVNHVNMVVPAASKARVTIDQPVAPVIVKNGQTVRCPGDIVFTLSGKPDYKVTTTKWYLSTKPGTYRGHDLSDGEGTPGQHGVRGCSFVLKPSQLTGSKVTLYVNWYLEGHKGLEPVVTTVYAKVVIPVVHR